MLAVVLSVLTIANAAAAAASWAILPMPSVVSAYHWLTGVSCPAPGACMTVGFDENGSGAFVALAERWNGSAWMPQPVAEPASAPSSVLNGISCPSVSSCFAVGEYLNGSGTEVTLAEHWDGRTWAVQPTPIPAGAGFSWLTAVSCTSATSCMAVGSFDGSAPVDQTLAESWDGTSWTIVGSPSTGGVNDDLLGISCTPAACLAVGYSAAVSLGQPLAMRWNGHGWSLESPPLPGGTTVGRLFGVSCVSATACTAVGWYADNGGVTRALTEGSAASHSWTLQSIPNPFGMLSAVSCTAASACTAMGSYQTGSGHWMTLAEIWNGSYWFGELPANLSGATDNYMAGVSCLSAKVCVAVGAHDPTSSSGGTLAELSV